MSNESLSDYHRIRDEVNKMIGNEHFVPQEDRSRDRLFRVRKGLCHVLCDVFPRIDDPTKQELYYWLEGIYSITQIESLEANAEEAE